MVRKIVSILGATVIGLALLYPLYRVLGGEKNLTDLPIPWIGDGTAPAAPAPEEEDGEEEEARSRWSMAVDPKSPSENVKRGLAWLIQTQNEDGGWAQGEESRGMGGTGNAVRDKSNVADTCMAALAILRSGVTPATGEYAEALKGALDYVCGQIESSDEESLYVTKVRGTRVQSKIGTFIDTFLSALLLAEVKGRVGEAVAEARVCAALDKVMNKIEKNQKGNGTWANQGWAPVLAQAIAGKAINRAAQNGVEVDERVRERAETYSRKNFDAKSNRFKMDSGAAGVQLYSVAANLGGLQDASNTNEGMEAKVREKFRQARSEKERADAATKLERIDATRRDLAAAQDALVQRLNDKNFVRGFGSNGGEEFLSYMNISESLVVKGGEAWEMWDAGITKNLNRVQNEDGSWTGHHCITGRTFCTSAALLVLMADRAPVPLAAKIRGR
ncbi:MAG: prenyltransferase/squalene oxidase repeat-containing protein [Planctomycetota bacterium]|jgi:hypothetical protein